VGVRLSTLVRRARRDAPAGDSDADLLARFARTGDASAFELLVWRHGAMVLAACRRVLGHDADSEDAFQAAFLVLARKAASVTGGAALPAWLHRVAVRVSARLARARRDLAPLDADPVAPPVPDPAVAAEARRALDEEIDRLPERGRRAVVLCYLEGLTAAEAARRLGCPTGTVESRLAAARKRLGARLARRGVALPAAALVTGALVPEAVARVARAGAQFAGGGTAGAVGEQSVRLAKGVLAMYRAKTWATVAAVAMTALTVATGVAWARRDRADVPPAPVAESNPQPEPEAVQPRRAPRAAPEPTAWTGKPVWVAGTAATVHDISADGTRFLISDGGTLALFDRVTSKTIWTVEKTRVHDAKFSPDGKTVACGGWQLGVNFFDAVTGKKLHTLPPGDESPSQVHYRPDGTLLYQTSASGFSASPPWTLKYSIVHYDPVARNQRGKVSDTVTYSTTNPWLWHRGVGFVMEFHQIFGGNTTTKRIVNYTDPITGKKSATVELDVNAMPLDLSPDGKTLLTMIAGDEPRLVDTATGKTKFVLGDHKRRATDGAYSPDGKLVVTVTGTSSRHATRGAYDNSGKVLSGPAEYVIWDAATGKEIARAAFPVKEFDFVRVQFSPDSKFLLLSSREAPGGKGQGHYAVGAVPFDATGGAVLTFPRDEAIQPKGGPPNPLVADPLDRLIDELAKSPKPAADKVDALFLAALGRFATAREQKWVKDTHGDKLSADPLRKVLAEIAKSPEFEAHIKSLEKRAPAKPPAPSFPGVFPGGFPNQPFGWPMKP
jgi:RNA polymerase sigma factor (sigma-70 family)